MYNTHAYTTHTRTHNSFYTVVMLQWDLVLVFFFSLFQHHVIRNNHKWVKNCRFLQKKKKEREETEQNGLSLNAIKKYSWSHTHHHISETLGKALAFPSHGSVLATAKVAVFSLDYKPRFSKTWCKQNTMESAVGRPSVDRTAHKLESIQGEILADDRPGSNTQT